MRKILPNICDFRIRRGFLFLPKKINGEIRWLESAEWIEWFTPYGWYSIVWGNTLENSLYKYLVKKEIK